MATPLSSTASAGTGAIVTEAIPDLAGSVEVSPLGYARSRTLLIRAVPNPCYEFDHWEGNVSGTANPVTFRTSRKHSRVKARAVFRQTCDPSTDASGEGNLRIVGYFPEWGIYRQPPYLVKNVVASGSAEKLAVLNYAFAIPKPDSKGVVTCQLDDPWSAFQRPYSAQESVDGIADDPRQPLRGHFNQLRKLKRMYPHLKIVVSIGGWLGSTYFSDAASTDATRSAFVTSCIDTYVRGNLPQQSNAGGHAVAAGIFDGFDLDWEFPVSGGHEGIRHSIDDATNFGLLVAEFRRQFKAIGREDLLLTAAVPAGEQYADNYRLSDNHPYLDYVLLMSYDFYGDWSGTTGHHTNLCPSPGDPGYPEWSLSVDQTVKLYRDRYRVPAEKILVGAAFYARGWTGVESAQNGLYQRKGGGAPGTYENGYELYRDLEQNMSNGYIPYWDDRARAAWLYDGATRTFWTFDEPRSLAFKARYVTYHKLGGMMFWEMSGDTDDGVLLSSIHEGLQSDPPATDPCSGM